MKTKKVIMKELEELRKKDLGFVMDWACQEGDTCERDMPIDLLMALIVDEYRKKHTRNSKAIDALKEDLAERAKSQQCLADIVMRLDTVANKWQAALNEQARINEMLIKRVEEVEKYVEAKTSIQYTGDNMRSGILNVCGGANDHYSDTVTAKPTDNTTLTEEPSHD